MPGFPLFFAWDVQIGCVCCCLVCSQTDFGIWISIWQCRWGTVCCRTLQFNCLCAGRDFCFSEAWFDLQKDADINWIYQSGCLLLPHRQIFHSRSCSQSNSCCVSFKVIGGRLSNPGGSNTSVASAPTPMHKRNILHFKWKEIKLQEF